LLGCFRLMKSWIPPTYPDELFSSIPLVFLNKLISFDQNPFGYVIY